MSRLNRYLYRSYRNFYVIEHWRKRRFTVTGLFLLGTMLASGILGIDTRGSMTYQIFTFTACLLIISLFWSLFFKIRYDIERDLPKYATVGIPVTYKITIVNQTNRLQKGLRLCELPQDPRPDLHTLENTKEPLEDQRNAWDRRTLYFRWSYLIQANHKATFKPMDVPDLPAHGRMTIQSEFIPLNRGYLYFKGAFIARPDPLGVFNAVAMHDKADKILILPRRYPIPALDLPGSREYHAGGVTLSSSVGNSDEFVALRNYRPGDSIRNIHWKSWAKTGELILKEFQDEYFVRHALILDTFAGTAEHDIFEEAVSVAASFASAMQSRESILDLMFIGNQAYCFSSGRGLSSTDKILEVLACVRTCDDKSISELHPLVDKYAPLLSGCVCIFLNWDTQRQTLLEKFRMHQIPVTVLVITRDKSLYEPQIKGMSDNIHILQTDRVEAGLKQITQGKSP